jgi:4-hydroxy-tetrahydrodipicolinate reductase
VGRLLSTGAPIVGDVREVLPKTDVVIDFTSPESTLRSAPQIVNARRALVVGTTGLKASGVSRLKALSRKAPIVFSPNMSVGVNLLFKLVEQAARALAHYDIEIVEAHHNLKKDAPSGTAMKLADVAAQASGRNARDYVYGREGQVGPRTKKEIGILSLRAGDIIGDHTVLLSSTGERLELTHRAHSRDAFAAGSLDAAAWIVKRRPGLYSMLDVLGLK